MILSKVLPHFPYANTFIYFLYWFGSLFTLNQGHTASVLSVTFVSAGAQLVSGGADGLLKLWTLRSDECEATLDAHTDKVWALTTAVAPGKGRDRMGFQGDEEGAMEGEDAEADRRGPNAGIVVVSGGADSVVNVWQDVTAREEVRIEWAVDGGLGGDSFFSRTDRCFW